MIRLNLGAGGVRKEGWTSLDRAGDVDVIHDLRDLLPFADGSCEGAVAHHVLDQLAHADAMRLLHEVHRVLAPGCVFRVTSPDVDAAIWAAIWGRDAWFPEPCATRAETLGNFILQGGARRMFLTPDLLDEMFREAGFVLPVRRSDWMETAGDEWICDLDSRREESWMMEACK